MKFFATRGRRREVMFGLPKGRPLNKSQRAALWRYAENYNRQYRRPGQHGGPLTHATFRVLHALLNHTNWSSGHCYPSIETLAKSANCACSTVQLALKALEQAQIINWINRLVFVRTKVTCPLTGRVSFVRQPRRTSNFYVFRLLDGHPKPVLPGNVTAQKELFSYDTDKRQETSKNYLYKEDKVNLSNASDGKEKKNSLEMALSRLSQLSGFVMA